MLGIEGDSENVKVEGTGIVEVVKRSVFGQCKIYNNPQLRNFGGGGSVGSIEWTSMIKPWLRGLIFKRRWRIWAEERIR